MKKSITKELNDENFIDYIQEFNKWFLNNIYNDGKHELIQLETKSKDKSKKKYKNYNVKKEESLVYVNPFKNIKKHKLPEINKISYTITPDKNIKISDINKESIKQIKEKLKLYKDDDLYEAISEVIFNKSVHYLFVFNKNKEYVEKFNNDIKISHILENEIFNQSYKKELIKCFDVINNKIITYELSLLEIKKQNLDFSIEYNRLFQLHNSDITPYEIKMEILNKSKYAILAIYIMVKKKIIEMEQYKIFQLNIIRNFNKFFNIKTYDDNIKEVVKENLYLWAYMVKLIFVIYQNEFKSIIEFKKIYNQKLLNKVYSISTQLKYINF